MFPTNILSNPSLLFFDVFCRKKVNFSFSQPCAPVGKENNSTELSYLYKVCS